MARYRGPKSKIARRMGEPIFGPDSSFEKRKYAPGQHGNARRRGKKSEYAVQLQEKQKAKYTYGILERQFANMFDKASRSKGKTGDVLLQLCESRLDNVVFRLGLGKTRDAARQLVGHRHITLNGELASIPSINVKPGDVIGVREKSKSLVVIGDSLASKSADHPWIEWNESKMEGTFLSVPSRDAIPENIKEQLIVELYSK